MGWRDWFPKQSPYADLFSGGLQTVTFRSMGTFNVPVVAAGQVIRGLLVAPPNPYRRGLRVKIAGPVGCRVFVSSRETVSTSDYFLDLESEQELASGPIMPCALFVAADVAGVTITLAELL